MRFILFLLFLPIIGIGQINFGTSPTTTNFSKAMVRSQASDEILDSMLLLTDKYGLVSNDSSLILAQKAMELVEGNTNKRLVASAQVRLGEAFRLTGDMDAAKKALNTGAEVAIATGEELLVAEAYDIMGDIFENEGAHEKALDIYIKAANIWENLGKKRDEAYTYINISGVFFDTNELPKAMKYNAKASKIADEIGDDKLRIDVGGMEALHLMTYGIHYYLNNEKDTATAHTIMDTLNHYFRASEERYHATLDLARAIKSKRLTIILLNNMVALKINMEKIDEALKAALEAEKLAEELGIIDLLIQSKFNLASIYRRFGKFDESAKYGEESLALAKQHKIERKEFLANRVLYDLYEQMGDYKKANEVLNEIRAYEKRVGDAERNQAIAKVEAEYETVKQEKEILELKEKNKRIARQRNYIISSLLLLGLILFSMFQFNKIRKERNDKKAFAEALMHTQEAERKRIAQDLHDGIGQSLLLLKKQLTTNHKVSLENQTMIAETLDEVRAISRDLHPIQLEKFGLTAAIQEVIQKVESSTDLFITADLENIDTYFDDKTNIQIYRAIQEALNNIVKHANATAAKINIENLADHVLITVLDNGEGFDYELAVVKSKSLGLKTMFERLSSIGGKMKISTNEPSGTKVEFKIPI